MNLDECAREPIHIPGTVQPHGALLVLRDPDLAILQVSVSARRHLGREPDELLGRELEEVLGTEQVRQLRRQLATHPVRPIHPFAIELIPNGTTRLFHAIVHRHDRLVLLELEPVAATEVPHNLHFFSVRAAIVRIQDASGLDDACSITAHAIASLTGFERVMIYRFDPSWNGEVLAEVRADDMEPYLGLRFPASDIPAQARSLYAVNCLRIIADVDYRPSEIVPPHNPLTGRSPDLSYAVLRSVSPVHLEYLRNMRVQASMSVSIMKDGELWGLIACHHRTPRFVPYPVRSACELLAEIFAGRISGIEHAELQAHRLRQRRLCELLHRAMAETDVLSGLEHAAPALLDLTDASGAAVLLRDRLMLVGQTPTEPEVRALITDLRQRHGSDRIHTERMSELHEPAAAYRDRAAGLLCVSLLPKSEDSVLWFRPELLKIIRWAGDPRVPVTRDASALHPRRSFAQWQEQQAQRSSPWLGWQIEAALVLRQSILEQEAQERRRVAEQARAQLEAALQQAQAATRAKSAFLANMSHEIRTPLNGCIGMLEMALDAEMTTAQRDRLEVARESAQSLLGIINDVLDLSKIEAGMLSLERTGFRLRELLERTLRTLAPEARRKGLRLLHEVAEDVPDALHGDPGRLRQLLLNLVGNALKFTHDGEVAVRISRDADDPGARDRARLRVSVKDTGIGISEAAQAEIFQPFTQADSSTTRRYGGTGLGLSICVELAHLMGGAIEVRSAPDHGSEFLVTVQFGVNEDRREPTPPPAAPSLPPLRALLAEDNPVNQRIACHLLKKLGLQVVTVADGAAAVAALEQPDFDLVLMDVQMPQLDGLAATEQIRKREEARGGHVPIIAMTAHAMAGDRERCLQSGMDDYVSKPVQLQALREVIGRVLARIRGAAACSRPIPPCNDSA